MHVVGADGGGDFSRLLRLCIGRRVENHPDWIHTKIGDSGKRKLHPAEEMAVRHESGCIFGCANRIMQNTLVFSLPPSVRRFRGVFLRRDAQTVVLEFKIRVVKRRI